MARPKRRKNDSPLDSKMQALQARQEQLRLQMEEHQRLIDDAPRIAKQNETQRRKDLMSRDGRVFTVRASTVMDTRAGMQGAAGARPRGKRTKREIREARLIFCFLLTIVVCLVGWLIHVLT